jgi:nucleoside-diphosphate-sugar epimerase
MVHVLLTGATGSIGSAVLPQLLARGHDVTAPVEDDAGAAAVDGRGGTGVVAHPSDRAHLSYLLKESEAVISVPEGGRGEDPFDRALADAAVEVLAGSGTPYVQTGDVRLYGSGHALTESDPYRPPASIAARLIAPALLESADLPLTVLHPGVPYGSGGAGIPRVLDAEATRTPDGRLRTIGSGEQHWPTVHVDDLAALYVAVVERGSGLGRLLGVSGQNPRVLDLSAAVAGPAGVATEDTAAARARLGTDCAEILLLDQQAAGSKARSLGWTPSRPSLIEELARR